MTCFVGGQHAIELTPPAAPDQDGHTALLAAARTGHGACAALLLSRGANAAATTAMVKWQLPCYTCNWAACTPRLTPRAVPCTPFDQGGYTALHVAAIEGHAKAVKALLGSGVAVDTVADVCVAFVECGGRLACSLRGCWGAVCHTECRFGSTHCLFAWQFTACRLYQCAACCWGRL